MIIIGVLARRTIQMSKPSAIGTNPQVSVLFFDYRSDRTVTIERWNGVMKEWLGGMIAEVNTTVIRTEPNSSALIVVNASDNVIV